MAKVSGTPPSDGQAKKDIMFKCFRAIHPAVDMFGAEFERDAKSAFFARATKPTDENYMALLDRCKDYVALTGHEPIADGDKTATDVFACMHVTLYSVLGYGVQYLSETFERAFDLLQSNIEKAKTQFTALSAIADDLVDILNCLVEQYVERGDNAELFMCAAVVLEFAFKSAHNLYVATYEKLPDVAERWRQKRDAYNSDILFYHSLAFVMDADGKVKDVLSGVVNELCVADRTAIGLADLRLFAFCVQKGMTERYLKHVAGNEQKHWYNLYKECVDRSDEKFVARADVVGRYLCETIDLLPTKRITYHSIFFECIALEWAYKNGFTDVAEKIIGNGYDRYLELDSLHIIRSYDGARFRDLIKELKTVCLYRHIDQAKPDYYTDYRHIRKLYGDDFCDDMVGLMKAALAEIDVADSSDPRNRSDRITPKWAK